MQIVNLTPHTINLHTASGEILSFPSAGVARVSQVAETIGVLGDSAHMGIPLTRVHFGNVVGLPDPPEERGVLYIVSAMVRSALPRRTDLASPGDLVRDADGNVIGCRNLIIT